VFLTCFACSMPFYAAPFSLPMDSQPALHPCNVVPPVPGLQLHNLPATCSPCAWLDARPQGVFDMFRLLNAATQPLPVDALGRRSASRHSAQSGVDMFRLLYAATQPLPMVIHSRHLALLHRLLHVCHLFHAPCSGGDFLPGTGVAACRLGAWKVELFVQAARLHHEPQHVQLWQTLQ